MEIDLTFKPIYSQNTIDKYGWSPVAIMYYSNHLVRIGLPELYKQYLGDCDDFSFEELLYWVTVHELCHILKVSYRGYPKGVDHWGWL